jgi:catechol 2,3-dioxygenase-like lactoylglutathione lyase family enzyme
MVGLGRIRQVKLPVSDLAHSVAWYLSVLDLQLAAEFVQQDILRGAVLIDPAHGWVIALRDRAVCAGHLC